MKRFFVPIIIGISQACTKFFPKTLKKRTWWPVFLVAILMIGIVAILPVHAQSWGVDDLINGLLRMLTSLLIELSKLCIFLTIFFLRAFITLASYNNFIDVSVVKLGWVMVRDVANMFFIVGLLVIAFATILGFESYEWKHGLVKIVLMAILINFSNLIAQLIIDVAHIFTITFLNAVSATAGGNLINMFQLDRILQLATGGTKALEQTPGPALFAGGVLAFLFALFSALTVGAYLVVMIFRIVYLWALIVLSPLAFMLYAVPKGEDYAHEWWSEFSKHVIVAPIMVFFLWLAFATLGTGQIISEIQKGPNVIQINSSSEQEAAEAQSVSILEISTWENLASFLLGLGFLWVGIKKTEETGAAGAGLVGSAIDFGKNVATIATGYAAGRWLVGGTLEGLKANTPIIGSKALARKATMIKGAWNDNKSKINTARDEKVQKWEKGLMDATKSDNRADMLKYGLLRFGVGTFLASSKKKDALAGTWEEKAHYADEEHEARISNSGTWGGKGKDEQRIKTELAVELKQAKGAQKEAEGLLNLKKTDDRVKTDLDKLAETQILGHRAQERLHTEEEEHHVHVEKDFNKAFESVQAENQQRKLANRNPMTKDEERIFLERRGAPEGATKFVTWSKGLAKMKAEVETEKRGLKTKEELAVLKEITRLLSSGRFKSQTRNQAELAVEKRQNDILQMRLGGKAQAEAYLRRGDRVRAEGIEKTTAAAIRKKENEEVFAGTDYNDKIALTRKMQEQLASMENQINTMRQSGQPVDSRTEEDLRQLRRQNVELVLSNMSADEDTVRDTMFTAMDQMKFDSLDESNRLEFILRYLTGSTDRNIQNLENTLKDLYRGPDGRTPDDAQYQSVLRQFDRASKDAVQKGIHQFVGVVDVNTQAGFSPTFSFKNQKQVEDWSDGSKGLANAEYWGSRSRTESPFGFGSVQLVRNTAGEVDRAVLSSFSRRGTMAFSRSMRGVDTRALANEKMRPINDSMNGFAFVDPAGDPAKEAESVKQVKSVIDTLLELKKTMNYQGYNATYQLWQQMYTNLASAITKLAASQNQAIASEAQQLTELQKKVLTPAQQPQKPGQP